MTLIYTYLCACHVPVVGLGMVIVNVLSPYSNEWGVCV